MLNSSGEAGNAAACRCMFEVVVIAGKVAESRHVAQSGPHVHGRPPNVHYCTLTYAFAAILILYAELCLRTSV